ncbi:MAG: penicillin-binding transpeptidase domain-containing protein [Patescibacteria group bacterium]
MAFKRRLFSVEPQERGEIAPEDIFIDGSNLPEFNRDQFEGRLEKPIPTATSFYLGVFFLLVGIIFLSRLFFLQINQGEVYAAKSENNRLRHSLIFAERGLIYDRNKVELAWNSPDPNGNPFALREYTTLPGLSHTLGYVKYPSKDSDGFYYQETFDGKDGIEKTYNAFLAGQNGILITETDAVGSVQSQNVIELPLRGQSVTLSIDSRVQSEMYRLISETAHNVGFVGGAGIIMDVKTGELLALTSFPEYSSATLSIGDSQKITDYINDISKPFLNRAVSGLYTPGSVVKPFMALAALQENIISPEKQILSTGSISIPNPYFPDKPSIFKDWKAHGLVDMRHALAVSSDVYFYEVGGGFEEQRGLGIERIDKYMRSFGFGAETGIILSQEEKGVIPTPEWKKETFDGEEWRIGDTYNTSIGQYGYQVTPLQMARGVASVANGGILLRPQLLLGGKTETESLDISPQYFDIVKEGMRLSVTEGTAQGLSNTYVKVAGKTGTAELGALKQFVNSWVVGFFPYENPRYVFTIVMERGPVKNLIGATYVMRQLLDWMSLHTPEYFSVEVAN